ncbi:ABC-type transport system involved in multi-copper enzyme maturation, permease component [Bhargavaea cecembensis DSE10]|uniref:ABC-type transport system involved in multi-copper enzyme maturation, permease component n=1 Tax=Bhargavaea cecembensis DSE10 TaxID=1235279 RepID=M7P7F1_9BACL|nr:ABC transporter permease [Bhargavaea cecembensis]EMR06454.1 ABC-type transport system involved in multi-copper enzyme maturation, permease component [Bhargavaea cecembensis DSE10]
MLKLLQNEWMKLWNKKATWVMAILLVAGVAGMMGLTKWISTTEGNRAESGGVSVEGQADAQDWRMMAEAEREGIAAQLADPDLSSSREAELKEELQIVEYRLAEDVEPHGSYSRQQMIKDSSGIATFAMLFAIIVAAGIVATEFSDGTIKMLLARPVRRWKVLTSKFAATALFGALLTTVGFVVSIVMAYILFSPDGGTELAVTGGEVTEISAWVPAIYHLLLAFVNIIVYTTFAFMIGSVFRSGALAIGLSLFIFFTGSTVSALLSRYEIAKYLFFSHDLVAVAQGMTFLEDVTLPFAAAVLGAYAVVFLIVSYLVFSKRDVTA